MNGRKKQSTRTAKIVTWLLCVLLGHAAARGQKAPASAAIPWQSPAILGLQIDLTHLPQMDFFVDTTRTYTLAELINLGEEHNPETRISWQAAKARAAAVGIARSDLFPTLEAVALAATNQQGILFNSAFVRQAVGVFQPTLNLYYTVLDFGARLDRLHEAKARLLAANLTFNDTHRKIIFGVSRAYYQLLNAKGQMDSAQATLLNAETVEQDAEQRLNHGLATLPDVLEAKAAQAQAEYDLQATIGAERIAHGDLATELGLSPTAEFNIQDIHNLPMPAKMDGPVNDAIHRAFSQRPDLLAQMASLRADQEAIKLARSEFYPTLKFEGERGKQRAFGAQDQLPTTYGTVAYWSAALNLKWTLFDGGKRVSDLAQAHADERRTEAEIDSSRDQISNEVWRAYVNAETSLHQQQAAASLLQATTLSYQAALSSYNYGVRNLLDVVAAQKALAQARSEDITARTLLLTNMEDLAFRTGDMLQSRAGKGTTP